MAVPSFDELWERLRTADESVEIEAKLAHEIGKSILETVSAFAREPGRGGGYLLLGVGARDDAMLPDYEIVGVADSGRLQADVATQCRTAFNVPIRPEIDVATHEGKSIVIIFVPEADPRDKPIYLQSRGLNRGAYRRIGSTDQICTDDDLAMFYQERGQRSYDETPLPETSLDDIEPRAVAEYRRRRASVGSESDLLAYSDEDLLYAVGATTREAGRTCLTLAGVVLFGTPAVLRRNLPMTRADYIRVEGREWVPDPDKRYQTVEKLGPLMLAIPSLVAVVLEDIPKAFSLADDGIHRQDLPLIPRNVIREAIVNALMHRNYRQHQPVQIVRYSNRIEIRNPGYSLIPDERLGEPGSKTRNPRLATVLHDTGYAETKGTGIRAMREAMERANLTLPLFESDRVRDEFSVRLLTHHLLDPEDWQWLAGFKDCNLEDDEARALIVLREVGAIDNASYRSINHVDTLTASGHLRRLRDLGLIEQRGKGVATYYLPGARLRTAFGAPTGSEPLRTGATSLRPESETLRPESLLLRPEFEALRAELPVELRANLERLGARATPDELDGVIIGLTAWRPLSLQELAGLTGRASDHLRKRNLKRLLTDGRLVYLYPDEPNHPDQKYVVSESERP